MYNQDNQQKNFRGITRTICVGLGGTGLEVLMRIRRLIVDRYQSLDNFPVVSFVHIDTDKAASQRSVLKTGNIYHGVDIRLKESEQVRATISQHQLKEFLQELDREPNEYNGHINPYSHIAQWFPRALGQNIKAVEDGASAIRPVGRLAFFYNYRTIADTLKKARQKIDDPNHESLITQKWGLYTDPGVNIFVVGSLCGGTGSGMFLDAAYSIRNLFPNAQTIAYLVISPELYGGDPTQCANTYAALKELNYYSTPNTSFAAVYDQDLLDIIKPEELGKRSPFDFTYLVGNQTISQDYTIYDKSKLNNVIAHKISLDFSGELAPKVKGNRVNFQQHLFKSDNHPRPNIQSYLTFGLSSIYFMNDTIGKMTLNRVSRELIDFWLTGKKQSKDPTTLLETFLLENRWHQDLIKKDGFLSQLANTTLEGGKNLSGFLSKLNNDLKNIITNNLKTESDRANLKRQIVRSLNTEFRKTLPGDNDNYGGDWLIELNRKNDQITQEFSTQIDEYIGKLLNQESDSFSLINARNWLDAMNQELESYAYKFTNQLQDLNSIKKPEILEQKIRNFENDANDIEGKKPFFGIGDSRGNQIQSLAELLIKDVRSLMEHNIKYTSLQLSLETVKKLQQKIQSHIAFMTGLKNTLDDIKQVYLKDEAQLKQLNTDEMNGLAIYSDEYIQRCYEAVLPVQDQRNQLIMITSKLLSVTSKILSVINNPLNLLDLLSRERSSNDFKQDIDQVVGALFGTIITTTVGSVIKQFDKQFNDSEQQIYLRNVFKQAECLLPINEGLSYFENSGDKQSKLIGFKDTEEPEIQRFKNVLTTNIGIDRNTFEPIQEEDQIIIVNEYGGFPMRLINGLDRLYLLYLKAKNNGKYLHNNYTDPFIEIIPPDAVLLQELQDLFFRIYGLGLFTQEKNTAELSFSYYDANWREYNTTTISSNWDKAIEELANDPLKVKGLQKILDETIQNIEQNPSQWSQIYFPRLKEFKNYLEKMPENHLNYRYKAILITKGGREILTRFMEQMESKLHSLGYVEPTLNASNENTPLLMAEIEDDGESINIEDRSNPMNNRQKRREEIQLLQRDLTDGILTQEEYDREYERIRDRYPI